MRPIRTVLGPIAAASANNAATVQTIPGAFRVTLNGALTTDFVANNISLAQAVAGAGNLTITGARAVAGIAYFQAASVSITSVGNDTGITFTVVGIGPDNYSALSEVVTGSNASVVSTVGTFRQVSKITASGAAAGNVSAGTNGTVATFDKPRRVLFTSSGNDSARTLTLVGTDWNGAPITETVAGGNVGTAVSLLDYATLTSITINGSTAGTLTVGTNGVAGTRPIFLDSYSLAPTAIQVAVTGTVNYTVQQSLDDPNEVGLASVVWINSADAAVVAAAATAQSSYTYAPRITRVVLNSGTGSLAYTVSQLGSPVL